MTTPVVLQKLEWPILIERLGSLAQTEEGRLQCYALEPTFARPAIESRWLQVEALKKIVSHGYRPPIGNLLPMGKIFRAVEVGQILLGTELRRCFDLLSSTRHVYGFTGDFAERCPPLRPFRARLYPLPVLIRDIEKAVSPDGELLDTASEELQRIRRLKVSLRNRIETHIRQLLHDQSLETYLQDDFYTVRNERYVVPIRLDGRGRVKGSIVDTSQSGQTLFMEPESVAPLNSELLELDLSEKLEIIRIFKTLTGEIANELEVIRQSYDALIELDTLSAEASFAHQIEAGPVHLVEENQSELVLDLVEARHPLIRRDDGAPSVASSVTLEERQSCLIISGPNAGGKTVVLKTIGLLHLMAKARLLIPAAPSSRLCLPRRVFLEMGDAQSLTSNLSTFSGHIAGLKPILQEASHSDLVLLDELATGTDPQTGAAIAQAMLENLAARHCLTIATTHFESLKSLAITDKRFRNGSMEYSLKTLTPTYRLLLDIPGQSFGIEVAEKMGLTPSVVERAKSLRGAQASSLDAAVLQLAKAREAAQEAQVALDKERIAAEEERSRLAEERTLIEDTRRKTADKLRQKYDEEMRELMRNFEETSRGLRSVLTKWQGKYGSMSDGEAKELAQAQDAAHQALQQASGKLGELSTLGKMNTQLPGSAADFSDMLPGTPVFVIPLGKKGEVIKRGTKPEDGVEVSVGILQMIVSLQDLRNMDGKAGAKKSPLPNTARDADSRETKRAERSPMPSLPGQGAQSDNATIPIIQTPTNSIDLRGMRADEGLDAAMSFLDKAVMRGESYVILIHGHGTDRLKTLIRNQLKETSSYSMTFRPGSDHEGGDGVTIVQLI